MQNLILLSFIFSETWPPTFDLFAASALNNPKIDFMVISNLLKFEYETPFENLKLYTISYPELNKVLKSRLDPKFLISENFPYKLCDLKPMFGEVFDFIVGNYTFWGHVDNDVVLGNLLDKDFLSDELFTNNDIVSSSSSMCNGPLQIYRNVPIVNKL